jgi:3-hydroxyisobutyrate dehydrogenase
MAEPIEKVAVLGTGIIGAAVARNLAHADFEVVAWNRTPDRADPLAADGVRVARSAGEAVAGADAIVTALSDADATADVMADALAEAPAGVVWVQLSTVGLEGAERLAALATDAGAALIDAPVLGTKKPADDGKLIVLAAGEPAARERCAGIFDAIGARTVDLGDEPGGGSRMKLVLNSWLLSLTAGLAESIGLAEALDVDPERFLEVLEGGPLDVGYAHLKGAMMISRDYETSFALSNAAKDARLVVEAGESENLELPVAAAIRSLFEAANDLGHGDADMAAVHEVGSTQADERPAATP